MFVNSPRDRMAKMTGNGNLLGAAKSEETDTGTTTVEISLLDAFEDKITISQVVCEPKPELESCEDQATETTLKETPAVSLTAIPPTAPSANQAPGMKAPNPTAAVPLEYNPQWTVGAQCQALWSEDGKVYAATIESIDGESCRVKFNGYGNVEDMPLSTLKPPEIQLKSTQEWKAGLHCRARFSDGLSYPAVVVWLKGQRCRVRFDHFNIEEELDVSSLLSPNELNGPGHTGRGTTWRPAFGTRRRREVAQQSTWQAKERVQDQSREDPDERRAADRPTSQSFLPFPSFPPPPLPQSSGDVPTFMPPPPPYWAFGGRESSAPLDPISHMLMLWYSCGFHTGTYLAQQQSKSSSRD